MEIVTDVSAIMAVLLNEPERDAIKTASAGHDLVGPGCIGWEVGNALYGALKRKRLTVKGALTVLGEFTIVPLRYLDIDMAAAIKLSAKHRIPAYDAYYLECANAYGKPLLTLDESMRRVAEKMRLEIVEVME